MPFIPWIAKNMDSGLFPPRLRHQTIQRHWHYNTPQ